MFLEEYIQTPEIFYSLTEAELDQLWLRNADKLKVGHKAILRKKWAEKQGVSWIENSSS